MFTKQRTEQTRTPGMKKRTAKSITKRKPKTKVIVSQGFEHLFSANEAAIKRTYNR